MSDELLEQMKREGKCGACEGTMKDSKHLNIVALDKAAAWANPSWGNILVPGSHGRAVGVVCDRCVVKGRPKPVKFALERTDGKLIYHPVEELKDVAEITEAQVEEGERRMFD
jgi:hypothetical protein